jgi:hypothetical protein
MIKMIDDIHFAYLKDVAYDLGLEHGSNPANSKFEAREWGNWGFNGERFKDYLGVDVWMPEEYELLCACYEEGFNDGKNLLNSGAILVIIPVDRSRYDGAENRDDYGSHPLNPPYGP